MAIHDERDPVADARERRIPTRAGCAWAFTDNLAAADILPIRFGALAAAQAATRLFADLDDALAARFARGDVLIGGYNLGIGAGGDAAARALTAAGFGAVVAGSFADAFDDALLRAGIPPLEVDAPGTFHTGNHLRINLEAGAIANLSSGDRQPVRNLTDELLERLRTVLGQ